MVCLWLNGTLNLNGFRQNELGGCAVPIYASFMPKVALGVMRLFETYVMVDCSYIYIYLAGGFNPFEKY